MPRPVDTAALAHIRRRLERAAQPPWLHAEVARRMAARLPLIRLQPQRIVDWAAQLGGGRALLQQAYAGAEIVAVEADAAGRERGAPQVASPRWWLPRAWQRAPRVQSLVLSQDGLQAEGHALAAAPPQLLWANMSLHLAPDPQALLALWQRLLAVDGFVMFSTLGPGSLAGLRDLYRRAGWPPPHAPFVDMHDLGDMLVEAGFADPVMDQETLTLHWPDPRALLGELRALGGNADPRRMSGLRTPRWRDGLLQLLAGLGGAEGRPQLQFEIVYGHAFKAPPRVPVAGVSTVAVEDLRAMARRPRRGAG